MTPREFQREKRLAVSLYRKDDHEYEAHMDFLTQECSDRQWNAVLQALDREDERAVAEGVATPYQYKKVARRAD